MTENATSTGLGLRKTALEAAGLTIESRHNAKLTAAMPNIGIFYVLIDPDGQMFKPMFGDGYFVNEFDAWQHAPAVESSIDAALEWLKLPVEFNWELGNWTHGVVYGRKWTASIYRSDATIKDNPIARVDGQSLAVAMCRAYLNYKGGAK